LKKSNKFIDILKTILPMCMAIGVQLAVASVVELVAIAVIAVKNADLAQVAIANGDSGAYVDLLLEKYLEFFTQPLVNDLLTFTIMLALVIVFGIWFFKSKYPKTMSPVGKVLTPRNISCIVIAGILGQICVSMLLVIVLPLFPTIESQYSQIIENLVGGQTIFSIIATVIFAPFAEELIFRGLTFGQARKFMRFALANFVQALLFGIYHMNLVQGVYAFLMGLVFGYVAYKLNNIFASMLFHAAINGSSYLLDYIVPEALTESTLGMLLVALICAIIIAALLYLLKAPAMPVAAPAMTVAPAVVAEPVNPAVYTAPVVENSPLDQTPEEENKF